MEATPTLTERLLAGPVVTLDMDGTAFDPWACCGKRDAFAGTPACRHLRADTVQKLANLRAVFPDMVLVVLSWRAGHEATTRQWLADVGIEVQAVFVPGSLDANAIGAQNAGQVGFKVNVVRALAAMGAEVLTSFDDNAAVITALRAEGVPAIQAPRLVEVLPHEWTAGRIGAAKPKRLTWATNTPADLYNDIPF